MKERPILFSGPMVRAILEGRKTQTRRVVDVDHGLQFQSLIRFTDRDDNTGPSSLYATFSPSGVKDSIMVKCPYFSDSGRLWVRETWLNNALPGYDPVVFYKADDSEKPQDRKWKPSIHMPRWASRLTLEIVNVRVERVQEISGSDVLAEGTDNGKSNPTMGERWENMQRMAFAPRWDRINLKRGFGWDANPWVWVLEFRRVE